ncbi:MAG: DinB family protein [Candidatus Thorarchaeota archaeon]
MTEIRESDKLEIMMSCIEMLFEHNFAVREPILDSIRQISNEDFKRNHGVGWGSVKDILVHLVNTEKYWLSVLKDKEMEWLDSNDYPDLDSIANAWMTVEKETREYLMTLETDYLHHVKRVKWPDATVSFTVKKALVHLATHEVHHRGLIVGLIRKMGHTPPVVDML